MLWGGGGELALLHFIFLWDLVGGKYFERDDGIYWNGLFFFKTIFYFTPTHMTKGQFVGGRLVGGKFPVPSAYTTHYLTPAFPSPKLLIIIFFIFIYICFPKNVITFQLHTKSGVCTNLIIHKNNSGIYTILYTSFPRLVSLFYYFIQLCVI